MVAEKLRGILECFHYQAFYFIFYGGYLPFLLYFPVYLKRIGLNAAQVGVVSGIRPIFQSIATPLLVLIGDRLNSRKLLFVVSALISITKLICLYLLLKPSHQHCVVKTVAYTNNTRTVTIDAFTIKHSLSKRDVMDDWSSQGKNQKDAILRESLKGNKGETQLRYPTEVLLDYNGQEMAVKRDEIEGNTIQNKVIATLNKTELGNPETEKFNANMTKPINTTANPRKYSETKYRIVNDESESHDLFKSLLIVVLITDMFDATMFTLVDHSCIEHQVENYGFARLWGTLGWGFMTPVIAMVLHNFAHEVCGHLQDTYHYVFIFAIAFANISLILGSHLKLDAEFTEVKVKKVHGAQSNFHYGLFLILFSYAGFCNGFLFTFVNWFIDSLGGSSIIMGVVGGCKCVVDVVLYFVMRKIIDYFDTVPVVSVGLVGHIAVFFMLSRAANPWFVVIIEVTHALFYGFLVSNCAYILDRASPTGSNLRLQALLHGIYWGVGSGSGAILSGLHIYYNGFKETFLIFTWMTTAVAFIYLAIELLTFMIDIKIPNHEDKSLTFSSTGSADADVSSEGQSSEDE